MNSSDDLRLYLLNRSGVCPNIGMRRFMSVQMIKILVVPSGTTYVIVMAKIKKKNVPKHHVAFQLTFKQNNSKEKSSSLCTSNDFCFIYQCTVFNTHRPGKNL
ncbi:hypothetical protein A0J61_06351 [Choanephora cucurbitarum]|uniref:Uncharacterized protein n=1 Tax=Choanephora cucurbitarum TaxID=101091 RepID=A0A1C7N931_9FUNG|nr:hypothetical protein A0J61_06351 [Choanephora cucurbitarum]